jgi:glycine hydroxymethyltransferase
MKASGLRIGTPAVTTRGMGETEMPVVAGLLDRVLSAEGGAAPVESVRRQVMELCAGFPVYRSLLEGRHRAGGPVVRD